MGHALPGSTMLSFLIGLVTAAILAIAPIFMSDAHSIAKVASVSVADSFDSTMRNWMASRGVPRGSIAVMRNDRLVFAAGYGGRAADERVAVWSMSKAVTGLCIAMLIQDKKLRFDDPIGPLSERLFSKYGRATDERLSHVTIAQLLTHRSGLPEHVGNNKFAPGAIELLTQRPLSDVDVDMLFAEIVKLRLATEPGSHYAYSNVGYLLLGQIIETVTNQAYEKQCGQRVLAVAGIAEPKLDAKWGRLLHSTAGWALSGPEYLGFVRLLWPRRDGLLTQATHAWLRSPEGKWSDDRKVNAYTLGIRLQMIPNAAPDIYHGGGWLWFGRYAEKRGTWFVLRHDGVAWFASYDGVHGDTDAEAVNELHRALAVTAGQITVWPKHDLFTNMGVKPISLRR
jgi:CubicO group peptidase (beta-lactamase class C family)